MSTLRTKRRYAHELYPHAEEDVVRPLDIEVPYLYSRVVGLDVWGTGWFGAPTEESVSRTMDMINARQIALLADALHQGLGGQEAWAWAQERMDPEGEWVHERADHYGIPMDQIKPYPCGTTPDHHDHMDEPDARGWRTVTRVDGPEDECPDCTEDVTP